MTYKETLKHPIVAQLTLIQFLSYFGTWFSQVAIASMLISYGASEIEISYIFIMIMLPAVLLAPISGWIIDRFNFKKLIISLLIVEIVMTALFMTINSLDDLFWLMIFLFIRSSASSMIFSAEMALFPKILKGEMLKNTNEIHSIVWSLCFAVGMAVGGVVTYYFSYDTTFSIDIILYLIALIILLNIKLSLPTTKHTQNALTMMRSGFKYLRNHKKLIHLILIHASLGFTSFDTIVTLLADFHYRYILAVPLAIGWINASRAIGLTLGAMLFGKHVHQDNLHYFFVLQGVLIIGWALVQDHFYYSLLGMLFVGLISTSLWSYSYYMIQNEIEELFLGRVIAYTDMIFMITNILTILFIGYASKLGMNISWITTVIGVAFIATGYYYLWFKKNYL